jgi:probable O-glycosylation ligase (exosortase A-associated)
VRDLILLVILLALCVMAWRRPWVGVLGLTLLGAMHPHRYGSLLLADFPYYKTLFVVTLAATAWQFWRARTWPRLAWDWRLVVLGLLFVQFAISSAFALDPGAAFARWVDVAQLLPPLLLALILIDTRQKLTAYLAVVALGVALVAVKGGGGAIMSGFADRVYGPQGSQIGGNNEFAVALAMVIPLLVFVWRQTPARAFRVALGTVIALCYVAVITSWSRGGLLALVAMTVLLVWHSQRKGLAVLLVVVGVGLAGVNLPQAWQARMQTLGNVEADQSFQGRQAAWANGLALAAAHPWVGAGFDGWYRANASTTSTDGRLGSIDWHSAYIEMLAEHGIPGVFLWGLLLGGTLFVMARLAIRARRAGEAWRADAASMVGVGLIAYLVGGLTLGIATLELMFLLLAASFLLLTVRDGV